MSPRGGAPDPAPYWGVFREHEHSPGRESDDAEILRLTAKHLEARGFPVALKTADEVMSTGPSLPRGVFLMCERPHVLQHLQALQAQGIPHVNSPHAVLNTYRECMVEQLREANVHFVRSDVVTTAGPASSGVSFPVWLKRGDVHYMQEGDVVLAETPEVLGRGTGGPGEPGDSSSDRPAPHVEGDLVKFYGIGNSRGPDGGPRWHWWFYYRDQRVAGYGFDQAVLAHLIRRAATALGLEVYGGDAIVTNSFIKLYPHADAGALEKKLPAFLLKHGADQLKQLGMEKRLHLQPIGSIHTTTGYEVEMTKTVDPSFLNILLLIAVLIQVIACINFMNLSTARASKRAKEVGVRKVIGAERRDLIKQFMSESFLLSVHWCI